MYFSWTNVPLFKSDCVAFAHIQQLWKFGTRFLLKKKKKSNPFATCQEQLMYKLTGNAVCNNFIIWPDNDKDSQLLIRNWTCLSSLSLHITVWFWNLAASSCWMVNYDWSVHSGSGSIMKLLLGQLGIWVFMLIQCYGTHMKHLCDPFLGHVKLNIF